QIGAPTNRELGTRRARAAALLTLALPGGVYVYQGEELGLWDVEDIPSELRRDPTWERSGHTDGVRDGCRVPIPWSGDEPPFGFGPPGGAAPWLPQPAEWKGYTVAVELGDERSMLTLYRTALRVRRSTSELATDAMAWLPSDPDVLAFTRGDGFACVCNMSARAVELPVHEEVVLASNALDGALLPSDTAVWLRVRR
ncbi:MAG TPA: alpha-glucosidase, partial [Micromonosporaceae bacterium]